MFRDCKLCVVTIPVCQSFNSYKSGRAWVYNHILVSLKENVGFTPTLSLIRKRRICKFILLSIKEIKDTIPNAVNVIWKYSTLHYIYGCTYAFESFKCYYKIMVGYYENVIILVF